MNNLGNTKAVFFDIDGTLVSFKTRGVLDSTVEAMRRLSENNILCLLATGRPKQNLRNIPMDLFDGYVTLNGSYCYTKEGEVLVDKPMDPKDVKVAVDHVLAHKYSCHFMENGRSYCSWKSENTRALEKYLGSSFPEGDVTQALDNKIYQLNAYLSPEDEHILMDEAKNSVCTRWSDLFIDVFASGSGKEVGAKLMLEELGIDPCDVIAIGDGGNDLGLFELSGFSIAMGNANKEVKERASYITDDCDSDGIYNALLNLQLI